MNGFAEYGRSAVNAVLSRVGRSLGQVQERRPLSYDLLETDEEYLVVFDAPGVEPEDVQVKFADTTLEVRLDRFRNFYDGFEMRFPGRGLRLSGSVTLPDDASVTGVDTNAAATLTRSGTLQVTIPKSTKTQSLKVEAEPEPADETESEPAESSSDDT
ncbi:Hsp20/alpha crystallin family protein [Halalkalirubrum salinum]|uniref:Hsp20/alpha crystallin family protein n=1 Tax=Halalkalirubrum salinum TaxID=2563889 RepID=UPI0010FAD0D3|nr:Hsp20/alpha crystallin family protein [Halalkalirubrum salinum]